MVRKIVLGFSFFFAFLAITFFIVRMCASDRCKWCPLPTTFTYAVERDGLASEDVILEPDLETWDRIALETLQAHEADGLTHFRLFAYLYSAQADFAYLSYNLSDDFEGSIDPISSRILTLFYPDFSTKQETDPYTDKLTSAIFAHYKERFAKEEENPHVFQCKTGEPYTESSPADLSVAKWIPWFISPLSCFLPPPLDEQKWHEELCLVRKAHDHITDSQMRSVLFWAGKRGPESGDWRAIANQTLFDSCLPLAKVMQVRSTLTKGLYDTVIATYRAKCYYAQPRPHQVDPTLTPHVPPPTTPSYPSGHASTAALTETILSYYLPEERARWKALAKEATQSRLWGGLHTPTDLEAGIRLGHKIGCEIISKEHD